MVSVGERPHGFLNSERGRSKYKYHRRKLVWGLIGGLVRQGHTDDGGMYRVYAVYGRHTSVSNIIHGLRRDKNGTLNPNLKMLAQNSAPMCR